MPRPRARAKPPQPREVALVFGRERTGLTNEELQLCHAAVHIPANPDYSSLNLAAAVQVLAYELRMALLCSGKPPAPRSRASRVRWPRMRELEGFFAQLAQTLDEIDFHKGRAPESAMRKLRRLFLRADLDAQGSAAAARHPGRYAAHGTLAGDSGACARSRPRSESR